MVEKLNKVVARRAQLVQQLGRDRSRKEVAAELDLETDEVREIMRMGAAPDLLEKPIGEERTPRWADFVEDEQAESPYDNATLSLRCGASPPRSTLYRSASARMSFVTTQRAKPATLEEVGRTFGWTTGRRAPDSRP